jgi:hypothetical protein
LYNHLILQALHNQPIIPQFMLKPTILLIALLMGAGLFAQDSNEKLFDVSLHGFVAVDVAHNTRVGRTIRNEHIYMFPLPAKIDEITGKDLNDRGNFDIDAAHSRFGLHIKGPTVNGISVFGLIEADFLGDARFSDSNFRLRHAYVRFGYKNYTLLAGQSWHPFFMPENFPQKVNTAVGVPMHPLSRNPQLRLGWKPNENTELLIALIEQNNFRTAGFAKGSEYAEMPEILLQVKLGGAGPAWAAFGAGYKRLAIPDNIDSLKTGAMVNGFHYQASFRYKLPKATIRASGMYVDNISEMAVPGGVGRVVGSTNENPEFVFLKTATLWTDIKSNNTTWDPGFFIGYLKALGNSKEVDVVKELSFHPDVTDVLSVAPRILYHVNSHTWIGLEYMYTQAAWGSSYDSNGAPIDLKDYVNHRTLLSFRYNF